jgi:hypothetical protein
MKEEYEREEMDSLNRAFSAVLFILLLSVRAHFVGPPLLPMTIQGYVTIQTADGTNMAASNLTVYAKVQNTTLPNNVQTVGLTDSQGKYTLSVGSSDNTVPPEGTPIDIWVQNMNVTRVTFHYQTFLPDLNLTLIDSTSRARGDINGDRKVDIYDAIILAGAFDSSPRSLNWNLNADINRDNIVDIYDAIILASYFGRSWT